MLKLTNITKNYTAGDTVVNALRGIDIEFRKSEFVCVLGPSGCGKTTLLNIIGGLDRYTEGDLTINGISTKKYRDGDWDSYRNHSVGFIFQSYNLITHQSVLSNVELALTISGVSKAERKKRAVAALEKVGLGDQIRKKPNQMSGGQMQRVAIARALVNDPDILLADEPTGALDSETSIQLMEVLREISKDRLIIMVTHNPELAAKYANRIVRMLDGRLLSDSNPYTSTQTEREQAAEKAESEKKGKPSISFKTALSLSLNNLMTKKARTILTSFAGSIGIIGIALILSLSNGVQNYINRVQEDTLSGYPVAIEAESVDMSSVLTSLMGVRNKSSQPKSDQELETYVYSSEVLYEFMNSMLNIEPTKNNLAAFKKYLETPSYKGKKPLEDYASTIVYEYDTDMNVYIKDINGKIIKSDIKDLMSSLVIAFAGVDKDSAYYSTLNTYSSYSSIKIWDQLLPGSGEKDGLVNGILTDQYEVVYGSWPSSYDEVVLVIGKNNEISDLGLYALGLISLDQLSDTFSRMAKGEKVEDTNGPWTFEEMCALDFRLSLSPDKYVYNPENGDYIDISASDFGLSSLYNSGLKIKISGVIRPSRDASSSSLNCVIGYTGALTEYVINEVAERNLVKEQLENPDKDILTGLPFKDKNAKEPSEEEKALSFREYVLTLSSAQLSVIYTDYITTPSPEYLKSEVEKAVSGMTRQDIEASLSSSNPEYASVVGTMDDETLFSYITKIIEKRISEQYSAAVASQLGSMTADQLAAAFAATQFTDKQYAVFYDKYMPATVSKSTYEDNLKLLGYVDAESPSVVYIYSSTFNDKDKIAEAIKEYNNGVAEEDRIQYTDYVAILMSSITTIINAITYVLVLFVSVSLVVSSIMIGIITYISVLERTKEIGILRSIGASKADISKVFNAETLIIGFCSGAMGILATVLLCFPINWVVRALSGIRNISASLPPAGAVILMIISMALTLTAGLIPSRIAAKKDPVEALRTE